MPFSTKRTYKSYFPVADSYLPYKFFKYLSIFGLSDKEDSYDNIKSIIFREDPLNSASNEKEFFSIFLCCCILFKFSDSSLS